MSFNVSSNEDPVNSQNLVLNHTNRFSKREGTYYRSVQPYPYHCSFLHKGSESSSETQETKEDPSPNSNRNLLSPNSDR